MKSADGSGNSEWFYYRAVKHRPEAAEVSSPGLGGKPIPFARRPGQRCFSPGSGRRLQCSCLHPKAPKRRAMLWKRRPANTPLTQGEKVGAAMLRLSLGLVLNWFQGAAAGELLLMGQSVSRRGSIKGLVGHQPLVRPQLQLDGGFLGVGKCPCADPPRWT